MGISMPSDVVDRGAAAAFREREMFESSLLRLYSRLGQANTYRDVLDALLPEISALVGYRSIWLQIVRGDNQQELLTIASEGPIGTAIQAAMTADEGLRVRVGDEDLVLLDTTNDRYLSAVIARGALDILEDARTDPRTDKRMVELFGNRTIIAVPLILAERTLGILGMGTFGDEGVLVPSEAQLDYLTTLSNHVAVAIDRVRFLGKRKEAEEALTRTLDEVEAALDGVVHALASTTRERDPYTARHQERVALLACAIAEEMGLPEQTVEGIRFAGMLHDVGKVAVPSEILSKTGALSDMEIRLIREHCKIGHTLLEDVPFHTPVAEAVLQHHERLDGSGYPDGLSGDAILPEARILAVADVIEAMTSHRPYRPAHGIAAAIRQVKDGAGTKFDREAVEACVRVLGDETLAFG